MRKSILMAAVALLASGAAMADNASGVWGGFSATATDGVVYLPDGKGGSTAVMGTTDSTGVNTAGNALPDNGQATAPVASAGDSFAGIAGYYSGVSASGLPTSAAGVSTAGDGSGNAQTFNTIGSDPTVGPLAGVTGYGQALVPGGAVDLSGQSVSTGESSIIANNVTAKTTGVSAGNTTIIGGGSGSFGGMAANGIAGALATNNQVAAPLLYQAVAGSVNNSISAVNIGIADTNNPLTGLTNTSTGAFAFSAR